MMVTSDGAAQTPELLGYVDTWSVAPEQTIQAMVSSSEPYEAEIIRLLRGGPRPRSEKSAFEYERVEAPCNGSYGGGVFPLLPGSYAHAAASVDLEGSEWVSTVAWVMPTRPDRGTVQGVVSLVSKSATFGLCITESGRAAAFSMQTGISKASLVESGAEMSAHRWYLLAASFNLRTTETVVIQMPQKSYPHGEAVSLVEGRLEGVRGIDTVDTFILAAQAFGAVRTGDSSRSEGLNSLDGKLERPRVALGRVTVEDLRRQVEGHTIPFTRLVADWDLGQEISSRICVDVSGSGHHAELVNSPLRAVTGHAWSGKRLDWPSCPDEYAAVHFHQDDMDDAGWPVAFEFTAPAHCPSGAYGIRLTSGNSQFVVPFFVRPVIGQRTADICVLVPTFTYMAYSNFETNAVDAEAMTGAPGEYDDVDAVINARREVGWSLYNEHSDGSGIAYVSLRRPMLDMQPEHRFWLSGGGGWAVSSDMYLFDWLAAKGYEYDVVTDHDLHDHGVASLAGYRAVITGSHPEYYSGQMLDSVETYLAGGGNLMYLGGNGFYWVTEPLPDRSHVLEIRRGHSGTRTWESEPGECYLSATGEPGGLWRHRGRAPQKLAGVGFCAQGGGGSEGYTQTTARLDDRVSFIFEGIEPDELIGAFGNNMGGAAGDEIDRADFKLGTPSHALVVATSAGRHNDFYQHVVEEVPVMLPDQGGTASPYVRADMTFFETGPRSGVFTSASIDWTASLSHSGYANNVSRITENVLRRFLGPDTQESR